MDLDILLLSMLYLVALIYNIKRSNKQLDKTCKEFTEHMQHMTAVSMAFQKVLNENFVEYDMDDIMLQAIEYKRWITEVEEKGDDQDIKEG